MNYLPQFLTNSSNSPIIWNKNQKWTFRSFVLILSLPCYHKRVVFEFNILFTSANIRSFVFPDYFLWKAIKGKGLRRKRDFSTLKQEEKITVTNLPRPWQNLAASGAISCGVRANVLWRPPKDWPQRGDPFQNSSKGIPSVLLGIAFSLLILYPDIKCKDTKIIAGMQTFYHKKPKIKPMRVLMFWVCPPFFCVRTLCAFYWSSSTK